MHMSRITKARFATLLVVGCWLALSMSVPARADGLDRFKKVIEPQIPAGTFSYKSSKALGDDGFVLQDAVYAPPAPDAKSPKPDPINIKTITVEHFDFDSAEKQLTPLYAKVKFDGVTSSGNAGGFDLKQLAGIDSVSADFGLDYRLDPDKRVFTLKRLELNLNGLGKLQASVVVDGLSADAATKPDDAMKDASLKSADFTYDDHSLLAKAVPVAAVMQGTDPQAMIALAIAFLDGARVDQGKPAQQAIDSLVAFVEDYQKPKGPLKVTLNPPGDVSNADLSNAKTADDIVKLLGIQVSYAGTRSSKPGEAAAVVAPAPGAKDVPAKDEDEDKPTTLDKKKD
jgi:hypothetical protein